MTSILKVDRITAKSGSNITLTSPLVLESGTTISSGIATMHATSADNNKAEGYWYLNSWDASDIDTFSNVANTSNDRFDIPIDGYYEIFYQVHIGVTGEIGSLRDMAIIISQTTGSVESSVSSAHMRARDNAADDTSDETMNTHAIIQCSAGDQIKMYYYANTDTGTPFDVYAKVGEEDDPHLYSNLDQSSNMSAAAIPKVTHCWLKKIA